MYNAKNKDDEALKGKVSYTLEDRKYFKHETIHNDGVGFYANVHNKIQKNFK